MRRCLVRTVLLFLGVSLSAWGAELPWSNLPDDASAAAQVRQEILPSLGARLDAAEARVRDAQAFLDGTLDLVAAFPSLANVDLGDPTVLDARLSSLDVRGAAREAQRHPRLPQLGSVENTLRKRWVEVIDAEAAADQALRRALQGLRGGLSTHPELRTSLLQQSTAEAAAALEQAKERAQLASEAERPATLAAVAALDESRRRTVAVADQLRVLLVRGGEPPSPTVDLELLASGQDGPLASSAAARLRLMSPWLDAADAATVVAAIGTWTTEVVRPNKMKELESLQAALQDPGANTTKYDVDETTRELAEQRGRFDALPEGEEGSAAWFAKAMAYLDFQIADARHDLAVEMHSLTATAEQLRAAAEAAKAQKEAIESEEDQDSPEVMRARSLSWSAEAAAIVGSWEDGVLERITTREATISDLDARISAFETAPEGHGLSTDPDYKSPDTIAAELRAEIVELGELLLRGEPSPATELESLEALPPQAVRREKLRNWEAKAEANPEEERVVRLKLINDTRRDLTAESVPIEHAAEVGQSVHERRLQALYNARAARTRVDLWLSPDALAEERGRFFDDIAEELELLPTQGKALLIQRIEGLREFPNKLRRVVTRVITDSVLSVVLLLLWFWIRRRREAIANQIMLATEPWFSPGWQHRAAHVKALERPIMPLANLAMAWLFAGEAARIMPELGILVVAFGLVSLVRLVLAVLQIFIAKTSEPRPTLATASDESYTLLSRMFGILGTWWVVGWTANSLLIELVHADAIATLVRMVLFGFGLVVMFWFLRRWETAFERRVRRAEETPGWVKRWLDLPAGRWFSPARAAVFGAHLAGWAAWDLAQGTAARGDGYGAMAAMMDQWRFVDSDEDKWYGRPLSDEERAALLSKDVPDTLIVPREPARDTLMSAFKDWREEERRGTVVVTGDRGDGKNVFLEWVGPRLSIDGSDPNRGRISARLRTVDDAISWFRNYFQLTGAVDDIDTLVAKVSEQPASVQIIEDVERAFLRNVGGFDALRTFLYVCNATSKQHFWVLVVHRPAWAYLSRLGSLMNTGVVRCVVDLAALTPQQLREMMKRRTAHVGLEVDFRRLENRGPFGALPEVEQERAITSYFRLLSEASGGCPLVALRLWTDSLRKRWDGKADVIVTPELSASVIGDMALGDLFVLTALRTQDRLDLDELIAVVNAPPDDVRATVRQLEHRGIVHRNNLGFRIDDAQLKSVTRTLRRRHFLQWAV